MYQVFNKVMYGLFQCYAKKYDLNFFWFRCNKDNMHMKKTNNYSDPKILTCLQFLL